MNARRTLRVVTDCGAPGLLIYGLHGDLASDTDDTDYEPGKREQKNSPKKKGMDLFIENLLLQSQKASYEAQFFNSINRPNLPDVDRCGFENTLNYACEINKN